MRLEKKVIHQLKEDLQQHQVNRQLRKKTLM